LSGDSKKSLRQAAANFRSANYLTGQRAFAHRELWSAAMDHILIRGLAARCIIGIRPEERAEKQDVVVNLALSTDLSRAGKSDVLDNSIDYRAVKKRVLAVLEASHFHLLEALAETIAASCLETPGVSEVRVTVDKPGALRFARSVAVEIVRRRPQQ
jgi:D-erythro-7,8-dihydroneopterin triphosphate epimerase